MIKNTAKFEQIVKLCVYMLTGWGKGGNVTSAGWQVILCDPIWHVSSLSSEAFANCYTRVLYFTYTACYKKDTNKCQQRLKFHKLYNLLSEVAIHN